MLKLYVVIRVWLYVRKGWMIYAIRLVRKHYKWGLKDSKRFVTDVRDGVWPDHRDYPRAYL